MRNRPEILEKIDYYKEKLAAAMEAREILADSGGQDLDLLIFSLVDKIEALFWVLELELPKGDCIDQIFNIYH